MRQLSGIYYLCECCMTIFGVKNRYAALAIVLYITGQYLHTSQVVNPMHRPGRGDDGFGRVTRCMTVFSVGAWCWFSPMTRPVLDKLPLRALLALELFIAGRGEKPVPGAKLV